MQRHLECLERIRFGASCPFLQMLSWFLAWFQVCLGSGYALWWPYLTSNHIRALGSRFWDFRFYSLTSTRCDSAMRRISVIIIFNQKRFILLLETLTLGSRCFIPLSCPLAPSAQMLGGAGSRPSRGCLRARPPAPHGPLSAEGSTESLFSRTTA